MAKGKSNTAIQIGGAAAILYTLTHVNQIGQTISRWYSGRGSIPILADIGGGLGALVSGIKGDPKSGLASLAVMVVPDLFQKLGDSNFPINEHVLGNVGVALGAYTLGSLSNLAGTVNYRNLPFIKLFYKGSGTTPPASSP